MTASARVLDITAEDIESAGGNQGGAYAALEVPGDYVATLTDIEDFDNRAKGGAVGWRFHYEIEGLKFTEHISLSKQARWKLIDTFEAHGFPIDAGRMEIDPNVLIGTEVAARVDFPKKFYDASPEDQANGKWYREIIYVFSLTPDEAPEELVGAEEVSSLDDRLAAEEPETF